MTNHDRADLSPSEVVRQNLLLEIAFMEGEIERTDKQRAIYEAGCEAYRKVLQNLADA